MTEEEILKEVISDDDDDDDDDDDRDDDDLDEDKEEEDLELVDESFQCPIGSVVMSSLDTLSIFGMFNNVSVKDDVITLTSKIET